MISAKNGEGFFLLPQYAGVLEYLREHPGSQARIIAQATNATMHTTRNRLLRMQAEGVVRSERYPKALLFYVTETSEKS
jgi:hypothetical protein